jgi:hypothetical protein
VHMKFIILTTYVIFADMNNLDHGFLGFDTVQSSYILPMFRRNILPACYTEVEVTLRPTVSRPVSLGVRRPTATRDQLYFLLEIFFRQLLVCNFLAPSLTRGRVCNILYNYFWALPEQSLLGRSPAELTALFYCII